MSSSVGGGTGAGTGASGGSSAASGASSAAKARAARLAAVSGSLDQQHQNQLQTMGAINYARRLSASNFEPHLSATHQPIDLVTHSDRAAPGTQAPASQPTNESPPTAAPSSGNHQQQTPVRAHPVKSQSLSRQTSGSGTGSISGASAGGTVGQQRDDMDIVFNRLMALEAFRKLHPSIIRNLCSYAFIERIDKGVVGE